MPPRISMAFSKSGPCHQVQEDGTRPSPTRAGMPTCRTTSASFRPQNEPNLPTLSSSPDSFYTYQNLLTSHLRLGLLRAVQRSYSYLQLSEVSDPGFLREEFSLPITSTGSGKSLKRNVLRTRLPRYKTRAESLLQRPMAPEPEIVSIWPLTEKSCNPCLSK